RQAAIDIISDYAIGPLFNPPLHRDNDEGLKGALWCPGDIGGVNIDGPPVADPEGGILYVTSRKHCSTRVMAPGAQRDARIDKPTGTTIADYAVLTGVGVRGPDDLNLFKPPYSRITAIDMNTGEHLWYIPVGETPEIVLNHPKLKGMKIPNTGTGRAAPKGVNMKLRLYAADASDGTQNLMASDRASGR